MKATSRQNEMMIEDSRPSNPVVMGLFELDEEGIMLITFSHHTFDDDDDDREGELTGTNKQLVVGTIATHT